MSLGAERDGCFIRRKRNFKDYGRLEIGSYQGSRPWLLHCGQRICMSFRQETFVAEEGGLLYSNVDQEHNL